jgi:hypothetical protein
VEDNNIKGDDNMESQAVLVIRGKDGNDTRIPIKDIGALGNAAEKKEELLNNHEKFWYGFAVTCFVLGLLAL